MNTDDSKPNTGDNHQQPTENVVGDLTEAAIILTGEVISHITGVPGGGVVGSLVSRYGKRLIEYHLPDALPNLFILEKSNKSGQEPDIPPFLVVGLGRCGCHVTAELAEHLAFATALSRAAVQPKSTVTSLAKLFPFNNRNSPPIFNFEPILVIGDIDETAFADVDGMLNTGGVSDETKERLFRLTYHPLATGGAGHVPLFAEFLTRSLLLLPSLKASDEDSPWSHARNFLLNYFSETRSTSRLVFYVFSTGGGSGAGSASEIMKAQRFAMIKARVPEPQVYFTGVAVLPQNVVLNQRHGINTGRTIVQYLSDLNLVLDDKSRYNQAPGFQGSAYVIGEGTKTDLMPWEGLAFISNDVMAAAVEGSMSVEQIESSSNRYIAQQMFNMAAAQAPTAQYKTEEATPITKRNYQSIRLDPQDLKTGLIGPYGICYSVASQGQLFDKDRPSRGIDRMFLRALQLPSKTGENIGKDTNESLIEGISVAPRRKELYKGMIGKLQTKLDTESPLLEKDDFVEISELEFFKRCPRIVLVFTVPQDGEVSGDIIGRLLNDLVVWTFPNLDTPRHAIVRGTTSLYTLSIFVESSVVLCPDVQISVQNYIKMCWKQRTTLAQSFRTQYNEIIDKEPPISDEEVGNWLGLVEQYGTNVPNFDTTMSQLNNKWQEYIARSNIDETTRKKLSEQSVELSFLSIKEVASALRFINYIKHWERPQQIDYDE